MGSNQRQVRPEPGLSSFTRLLLPPPLPHRPPRPLLRAAGVPPAPAAQRDLLSSSMAQNAAQNAALVPAFAGPPSAPEPASRSRLFEGADAPESTFFRNGPAPAAASGPAGVD